MAGTAPVQPTYQDYQSFYGNIDPSSYADSSRPDLANEVTEDQWNGLSDDEKWLRLGGRMAISPDDSRYKDLFTQLGGGQADASNPIVVRYNSPLDPDHDFTNPSNVLSGNGVQVYLHSNLTPGAEQGEHSHDMWWQDVAPFVVGAGLAIGGGALLAGAAGGAGASAGTVASTAGDTGAFDVGGSTGFGGTTPLNASTGLDTSASAGALEDGGVAEPGAATPAAGAPVSEVLPAGTQAAAPVTEASVNAPSGILNGVRNAATSASNWYDGLSSGSRFLLGQATSQGANAILRGVAQRNAMNEQEQLINQQREDQIRRSHVDPFSPNAFTPKTGIVDGVRNGG